MDTSLVTSDELKGFYSFAIATEGFSALATAVFFPIILQSLAAANAYQHDNPSLLCVTTGAYKCDVKLLGYLIDTSSLVLYSTSAAVILQIFLFTGLGSLADHGPNRKTFMMFFATSTAALGLSMIFVIKNSLVWLAFLIYILSTVTFGASYVFYYSFVPILTRYSPVVVEAMNNPLLSQSEVYRISDQTGNEISSKGFRLGYFSAVLLLTISCIFAFFVGSGTNYNLPEKYPLQIGIAFTSLFQLIILYFYVQQLVKARPGPPLPKGTNFILHSYSNLWKSLKQAKRLAELFKFLGAWFVYSDTFATVTSTAILFAQSELGAPTPILLLCAILVPLFGGIGTYVWLALQTRFKWTTQQVLGYQTKIFCLLPIYGLLGFMVPSGTFFGFQNKWELPFLASFLGFLLGSTQSTCRVYFAELLPHGHEAEFFGLYEVTDKGSSWIGPLVVALIGEIFGSLRWSFLFLLISFVVAIYIFSRIDVVKGQSEARAFSSKDNLSASQESLYSSHDVSVTEMTPIKSKF